MAESYEIKKLEEVLEPFLQPNKTFVDYEATLLTSAGENYGSLMLAVRAKIKNSESNEDETLNVVAKMCPVNEILRKIFNVSVTVKKEINLYGKILEVLKQFLEEYEVEETLTFFAGYFGSRISLDSNSTIVDQHAVLLLENLKWSGFTMVNRLEGFDYETAKIILKDLAIFHAIPLAYKLLKPECFEQQIMPHLDPVRHLESVFHYPDMEKKLIEHIVMTVATEDARCREISSTLQETLNRQMKLFKNPLPVKEPFGTISHNDLWVNNIMVKYVNGKPNGIKFVDFQLYSYNSLAIDLIFLLLTSVRVSILSKHFDEFIQIYHERLLQIFKKFGCDIQLRLEDLWEEIDRVMTTSEMLHVIIMYKPIFAEKGLFKDMTEFDINSFTNYKGSELYQKKLAEVIIFIRDQGWL